MHIKVCIPTIRDELFVSVSFTDGREDNLGLQIVKQ